MDGSARSTWVEQCRYMATTYCPADSHHGRWQPFPKHVEYRPSAAVKRSALTIVELHGSLYSKLAITQLNSSETVSGSRCNSISSIMLIIEVVNVQVFEAPRERQSALIIVGCVGVLLIVYFLIRRSL